MEKELESKIFKLEDYNSKKDMEEHIKEYMKKLKNNYPYAVVTKEFYKVNSILVRATQINFINKVQELKKEKEEELEKEETKIKERGINGIGENVYREKNNGKSREIGHSGGSERERGGR